MSRLRVCLLFFSLHLHTRRSRFAYSRFEQRSMIEQRKSAWFRCNDSCWRFALLQPLDTHGRACERVNDCGQEAGKTETKRYLSGGAIIKPLLLHSWPSTLFAWPVEKSWKSPGFLLSLFSFLNYTRRGFLAAIDTFFYYEWKKTFRTGVYDPFLFAKIFFEHRTIDSIVIDVS